MGEGKDFRKRGEGRGTPSAFEQVAGGFRDDDQSSGNRTSKRGNIIARMDSGENPAPEYDAPPRKNLQGPKPGKLPLSLEEKGKSSVQRTSRGPGGLKTAMNKPVEVRKEEGKDLSENERKKLDKHIQSIVQKFDFVGYLEKEDYLLSDEDSAEEIKKLIFEEIEEVTREIVSYLINEYGEESIKKSILDDKLPELELFEDKLRDIVEYYYLEYKNALERAEMEEGTDKTGEADMPGEKKGDNRGWLGEDYIKLIEDYYKKLFFEESNLAKVLKENGLETPAAWVKKTRKLLETYELVKNCLEYTLEVLLGKYKDRAEELKKAILGNELDKIPEIKQETTKAILVYYEQALEAILEKTKVEKNRNALEAEIKKVRILLGEETPNAAELTVDKSGENVEQKELRKKISEAIELAVGESVARIDFLLKEVKSAEVDKGKLEYEKEKIKKHLLENIDEHAGLILRYLGNDYKNPYVGQSISVEARRIVANAFAESREIEKILPKGKILREEDLRKKTKPVPEEKEVIRTQRREDGEKKTEKTLKTPEQEKLFHSLKEEISEYCREVEALVEKHGEKEYWSREDIANRARPHAKKLFLKYLVGEKGFSREECDGIVEEIVLEFKKPK